MFTALFIFTVLTLSRGQETSVVDEKPDMMLQCNFQAVSYKACVESLPAFPTRVTVAQTLRSAVEPKMDNFAEDCFKENSCTFKSPESAAEDSAHKVSLAVCIKVAEMDFRKGIEACVQNGTHNPSFRLPEVSMQTEAMRPKSPKPLSRMISKPFGDCKLANPSASKGKIAQCIKEKQAKAQEDVVTPAPIDVMTPKEQLEKLNNYCLLKKDCQARIDEACSQIICNCRKAVFDAKFKAKMRQCMLDNGIPSEYFKEFQADLKHVVAEIDSYCGNQRGDPCQSKKVQKEIEKMEKEKMKKEEEMVEKEGENEENIEKENMDKEKESEKIDDIDGSESVMPETGNINDASGLLTMEDMNISPQ